VEIELEEDSKSIDCYLKQLFQKRYEQGDPDTSSDCSFQLAAWWLDQCRNNHSTCPSAQSVLPSRVINVGPPDGCSEPFLYESRHESALYITLSHCWGDLPPLTTTTTTLAQRKQTILLEELPKTFQDAVIITRRFNVRYLWIDSLCILQDSASDWETHSSRMCSIYKNSLLTIAATHAPNSSVGCFAQRDGFLCQPHLIDHYESQTVSSFWIARLTANRSSSSFFNSPLFRRAWVYQEEMLSSRTLYYTAEGLRWRCRTCKASESYPDLSIGMDDINRFQQKFLPSGNSKYRMDIKPLGRFGYANIDALGALRRSRWHEIVEEYTVRLLKNPSDKLAALLGIADAVGNVTGEEYIAGLWKGSLFLDLLWFIKPYSGSKSADQSVIVSPTRIFPQVAPSWSWASVNRPIQFPGNEGYFVSSVTVMAENIQGTATCLSGTLRVYGLIRRAFVAHKSGLSYSIAVEDKKSGKLQGIPAIKLVPDEPIQPGTMLWLLELAHLHTDDPKRLNISCNRVYSLGLNYVDGNFRRVGLASWPGGMLTYGDLIERCTRRIDDKTIPGTYISKENVWWSPILDDFVIL